MEAAQLEDAGLDRRGQLVRADVGASAAIDETSEALGRIAPRPAVHGLAAHSMAPGHIGHRRPVIEDVQHGPIALFHEPQLHQHDDVLLRERNRSQ
jgi:hypothetical protein